MPEALRLSVAKLKCGPAISVGVWRTTAICWDGSPVEPLLSPAWGERKLIFCGSTTVPLRPGIRATRRRSTLISHYEDRTRVRKNASGSAFFNAGDGRCSRCAIRGRGSGEAGPPRNKVGHAVGGRPTRAYETRRGSHHDAREGQHPSQCLRSDGQCRHCLCGERCHRPSRPSRPPIVHNAHISGGKFAIFPFYKENVMNFLSKLLRGIAFIPAVVHGIEGLFGSRSGSEKKEAALSFVSAALSFSEAVAAKDIADEDKFREGLSKVIDGTVQCLN